MRSISLSRLMLISLLAPQHLIAQAPAPVLSVESATKSQVVLNWQAVPGASTYSVARRAVSDGAYSSGGMPVASTTYTDTNFDPFTAYSYRVVAVVNGSPGPPSNEVTAGPPPTGFSAAAPFPKNALPGFNPPSWGNFVSITLDSNGDPALAFDEAATAPPIVVGKNSFNANSSNIVDFVGWDRAHHKWKAPVAIDNIGGPDVTHPNPKVQVAYDASTNIFGVLYNDYNSPGPNQSNPNRLLVAFSSDSGVTWNKQDLSSVVLSQPQDTSITCGNSLKMANGQVYLLSAENAGVGLWYLTGSETATPTNWAKQKVPSSSGLDNYGCAYDLALDSNNAPAVAFGNLVSGVVHIYFWRPTATTATSVTTANGTGQAPNDVKLGFAGPNPRVFMDLQRNSLGGTIVNNIYLTDFWVTASNDGGTTWTNPVQLPDDGNRTLQNPTAFAVNAQGEVSAVARDNGGNFDKVKCGWPKLIRSQDLVNFTACNPGNSPSPIFSDEWPAAVYGSNGKLFVAFQDYSDGDESYRSGLSTSGTPGETQGVGGVYLWREAPQPGNLAAPTVSTGGVVLNAGFPAGKPVAPGSIISIFGTNLSTTAALSGTVPLPEIMGISPVAVSVSIHGIQAPLFHVLPLQIDAQVPFEAPPGLTNLEVLVNDSLSLSVDVQVAAAAPGIYAIINADGSTNPGSSAKPGDVLTVYITGLGTVSNPPPDGSAALANPLSDAVGTVKATIGGQVVNVSFAGLTPGSVGLYQCNIQAPALANGKYPLVVSEGSANSASVSLSVAGP
jgi:uncharacterized protein (TIGR03437 family)